MLVLRDSVAQSKNVCIGGIDVLGVTLGVKLGVLDIDFVKDILGVSVIEGVMLGVSDIVGVIEGVIEIVGVIDGVSLIVGVILGVIDIEGVIDAVGVSVIVGVIVIVTDCVGVGCLGGGMLKSKKESPHFPTHLNLIIVASSGTLFTL